MIRSSIIYCMTAFALGGLPGCRVAGRSFQMDSDARTPFLGINLLPTKEQPREVRPTGHDQASTPPRVVEDDEEQEEDAEGPAPHRDYGLSRLKGWLNPLSSAPQHVPLPRTDLREGAEAASADSDALSSADDF